MEKPKISVIIPVYNTDLYVREAILSIQNQTLSEIEILIINDGSTDNSLAVVNGIAKKDKRIKVFSQENQGQAVARNLGLNNARGKYVYFMDSDDKLDNSALEKCYIKCEEEKLDFVFFDADIFGDQAWTFVFYNYVRAGHIGNQIYKGQEILDLLLEKKLYRSPVWLYVVKLDYIKLLKLSFFPVRHEDELFTAFLHLNALRVGFIPLPFFKRRLRQNSVMTSSYSDKDIDAYLFIINKLLAARDKNNWIIIDKLVKATINPAIYNSHNLSTGKRFHILWVCIFNSYLRFLRLKSIVVLLFPFTIQLKAIILQKKRYTNY